MNYWLPRAVELILGHANCFSYRAVAPDILDDDPWFTHSYMYIVCVCKTEVKNAENHMFIYVILMLFFSFVKKLLTAAH